jgi:protein-tyrosine phosphatase
MAEALAKQELCRLLDTKDLKSKNFWVGSAGIFAAEKTPASPNTIAVMAEKGMDLSGHRSRSISHLLLYEPDFLYAMTNSHLQHLQSFGVEGQCLHPEGYDVSDPFGGDIDLYRNCRDEIGGLVAKRATDWLVSIESP